MEVELEESREVAAPRDDCWEVLTDPARAPEWMTAIDEASSDDEPGEGRVIHARGGLLGVHVSTQQRVHLWEPRTRYGWSGDRPFPLAIEITLTALEPERTRVDVWGHARPGRFFPVGGRMVRGAVRRQLSRSADNFQRLVERPAS
jgi:carbon monoxide dehydrogenase subunit G